LELGAYFQNTGDKKQGQALKRKKSVVFDIFACLPLG